jgi:alkanesulfonate monooxygenase SsuD/methylene tetrahydromethanopterin reductase-like flavin-dependent oxidoreductase (luciferase family)
MEVCEIDPGTRGRRTNECLEVLRALLGGEPVQYSGEFIQLEDAWIRPAPDPPVPLTVGGRSDAAVRRAALLGDGWLATWCSPRRFAEVVTEIDQLASAAGRNGIAWRHGLQTWCGVDPDPARARAFVAEGMEQLYRIPFERFEKYTPYGTAEDVANFLAPYVDAGACDFNITAQAASSEAAIEATAEIRDRLLSR